MSRLARVAVISIFRTGDPLMTVATGHEHISYPSDGDDNE